MNLVDLCSHTIGEQSSMLDKSFDYNSLCHCVTDFESLGDGRHRAKVLLGDRDDARLAHLGAVVSVEHNWPCLRQLRLSDGKVFDTLRQTVNGERAYIFWSNEVTEGLLLKQIHLDRFYGVFSLWSATATSDDCITLAKLIVEQAGTNVQISDYQHCTFLVDYVTKSAIRAIFTNVIGLNVRQLRDLYNLLGTGFTSKKDASLCPSPQ